MFSEFKPLKSKINLSISEVEDLLLEAIKYGSNTGVSVRNVSIRFTCDMNKNELWFFIYETNKINCFEDSESDTLILNYKDETYHFASGGLKQLLSIKALKRLFRLHKIRKQSVSDKWKHRQDKIMCRVMSDINGMEYVGADVRLLGMDVEFLFNYNDGYSCVLMIDCVEFSSRKIEHKFEQDVPTNWIKFLN